MVPLIFKQLWILLWKGWILRKVHWISSIFELIFPLFLTILFISIRASSTKGSSSSSSGNNNNNNVHGQQPATYYPSDQSFNVANLFNYNKIIYYTPINSFTDEYIKSLKNISRNLNIIPFENEDKMVANISSQSGYFQDSEITGVVLDNNNYNFNYKIRSKSYSLNRNGLFPTKSSTRPYCCDSPYLSGFTSIQIALNEAYLNFVSKNDRTGTKVAMVTPQRIPYPPYIDTNSGFGNFSIQDAIAWLLIVGYIAFCPLIVKRITDEKVAKAKEMLRMMGMSDWVFWTSHFINYFSVMIIHSILFTIFYFYGWGGTPSFLYSDAFLFFCIMILYSASTIMSCMLLTTVFNRPVIAVVVTVILYLCSISVVPPFLSPIYKQDINIEATQSMRILSCFLPNMALEWALTLIGQCENYGYGANWGNLWSTVSIFKGFTIGLVMLMQLISCFFYGTLIWYIDNVWPFQYGIPKPLWFPFLPSYWMKGKKSYKTLVHNESSAKLNDKYFEPEPNNTQIGISCQHLRKIFDGKQAVCDMSLNMLRGQITVLLGHNGAGKTTTMNMITGIFPPTSGTALVNGYDIRHQTKSARRSIALCPQENILYNELNVYEHLKLYAVLKDHPLDDVDNEINKMLQLVALMDKKITMSSALSGGMKRKLSLAIAMIANSQILILDEPTSGMDPEARRHIWDVLQGIRSQRTILLTTHYMEEADVLGDRIAIMNEGMVKCSGTPMFLKRTFGAGFHLRIAKTEHFNSQTVLEIVKNYMPNAQIKSDINTEIIYSLESQDSRETHESNPTSALAPLFDDLERRSLKLGINSCGLTVTTMEDVFLRVGNECNDDEVFSKNRNEYRDNSSNDLLVGSLTKNYGSKLLSQQFRALILKRIHYAKRYWPMLVLQSVLPGILFMIVLLIDYYLKKSFASVPEAMNLNLNMYGNNQGFLESNYSEINNYYKQFADKNNMNADIINKDPNVWCLEGTKGDDLNKYTKTYLAGAQVNQTATGLWFIPWYNSEAYHTLPPSLNILYESLLKLIKKTNDVSITVYNHAIPENNATDSIAVVFIGLIVGCILMVPITVPFIGASYVLFPVHERVSNSKLLQLMNGISPLIFWSASFVFDLGLHLVACVFIFIVFAIFDFNHVFLGQGGTGVGLFLMLFLFGFASIPLAYIVSLRLKKPSSGFAFLVIIYLISGIVFMLPLGICDILINSFHADFMSSKSLDILLYLARFLPVFSMSFGIQKLYKVGSFQSACDKIIDVYLNATCNSGYMNKQNQLWGCCKNLCQPNHECYNDSNPLRWGNDGVAVEFFFLILSGIIYLLILWLIEGNFERLTYLIESFTKKSDFKSQLDYQTAIVFDPQSGQWIQAVSYDDPDVAEEKRRITDLCDRRAVGEEAIVVKDLSKTFGKLIPIQAVNKLSFGVHKEECFGLLGVNGAGKTTTFRMLTGDETVTAGNAFINYLNLKTHLKDFQKQIGYCPQFDALLDKMTGRETLYLYARLRGMDENIIESYVKELVEMVDLVKHVDKCTETYSGGNRRKLSLAIALCASPPVIFLDEPTSGVDPSARRKIWSTLVHIQEKYQSAIILTSHSMEECEALCSRIAIMVNGEFKCMGSVQHLRSKFGQGFTVMAKLKRELVEQSAYLGDLQTYFKQQIPCAVLKDIHQCLVHYHIPDTSVLWSHMFTIMEEIKAKYYLEDYIISDTTLEQIFLAFARSQR